MVVLAIIGAVIAVICLNRPSGSDVTEQLEYANAFFINDNGNYTLWSAEGKRLTNDEYSHQSRFVGGFAYVSKDDQDGIIRENGTMSVDFGKYGDIMNEGGLYVARDGNTKEEFLITGDGKVLEHGTDLETDSTNSTAGFALVKAGEKYRVYSYNGSLIAEMNYDDSIEDPALYDSDDFGSIYYNNKNTVFDVRSGKILAEFEGDKYRLDSISEDRKLIILEGKIGEKDYKLIVDGKIYDLDETKYYGIADLDTVIGYDNYDKLALLDENYKVAEWVSTYLELKDYKNYAVENEDEETVEIYKNGEKIATFADEASIASSGVLHDDYYAIKNGGTAKFYNLDGTPALGKEFKYIRSLFDENHHAVVADEEDENYLIDTRGERIGDYTFKGFASTKNGYRFKNKDGEYAIANKDGKLVTEFKYTDVDYYDDAEPHNIWAGRNSYNDYDIIDVEKGVVLYENAKIDDIAAHYFAVKTDNGVEYYTFDGKLFYTVED